MFRMMDNPNLVTLWVPDFCWKIIAASYSSQPSEAKDSIHKKGQAP